MASRARPPQDWPVRPQRLVQLLDIRELQFIEEKVKIPGDKYRSLPLFWRGFSASVWCGSQPGAHHRFRSPPVSLFRLADLTGDVRRKRSPNASYSVCEGVRKPPGMPQEFRPEIRRKSRSVRYWQMSLPHANSSRPRGSIPPAKAAVLSLLFGEFSAENPSIGE